MLQLLFESWQKIIGIGPNEAVIVNVRCTFQLVHILCAVDKEYL